MSDRLITGMYEANRRRSVLRLDGGRANGPTFVQSKPLVGPDGQVIQESSLLEVFSPASVERKLKEERRDVKEGHPINPGKKTAFVAKERHPLLAWLMPILLRVFEQGQGKKSWQITLQQYSPANGESFQEPDPHKGEAHSEQGKHGFLQISNHITGADVQWFLQSAKSFLERAADLGWDVIFHNTVQRTNYNYPKPSSSTAYFPVCDFAIKPNEAVHKFNNHQLTVLKRCGFEDWSFFTTGRSYHGYGPYAVSFEEWQRTLGRLLQLNTAQCRIVDEKWIGHVLETGDMSAHLRWTAQSEHYLDEPRMCGNPFI